MLSVCSVLTLEAPPLPGGATAGGEGFLHLEQRGLLSLWSLTGVFGDV